MDSENKIVKQEKIILYENGTHVLRRYDEKSKMWVTLQFTEKEDPNLVENIINIACRVL